MVQPGPWKGGTLELMLVYLNLRPSHKQTDVLVLLAGEQGHRVLTVLDLNAVDLDTEMRRT